MMARSVRDPKRCHLPARNLTHHPASFELQAIDEQEVKFVLVQVGLALQHCHRRGVLHRDVKPVRMMPTFHRHSHVHMCAR